MRPNGAACSCVLATGWWWLLRLSPPTRTRWTRCWISSRLRSARFWTIREALQLPAPAPEYERMAALFSDDSFIRFVDSRLMIDDLDALSIAERFGTPLYVTSEQQIRANCRSLHRAFSTRYPRVELLYANKANSNLAVRRILTTE